MVLEGQRPIRPSTHHDRTVSILVKVGRTDRDHETKESLGCQHAQRAGATAEADPLWRTDNRGFYEADEEGPPPHIAPGAYAAYLQAVRA